MSLRAAREVPRVRRISVPPQMVFRHRADMMTMVLATRNSHKAGEIAAVLGGGHRHLTLAEFPEVPHVVEDADDFAGNASKKALSLAKWLCARKPTPVEGRWLILADDSGLEVDALQGAPGVRSARFAALDSEGETNSTDAANNSKLIGLMASVPPPKRSARFRCAIVLAEFPGAAPFVADQAGPGAAPETDRTEPLLRLFEGMCEGVILSRPQGENGFGYDPLFQPTGYSRSFAELGEGTKNRISHRAVALAKVKAWLATR